MASKLRDLIHAAFCAMDDSIDDGGDYILISRDNFDDINAALDALEINDHEDIDKALTQEQPAPEVMTMVPVGYAGATVWIGDSSVTQIVSRTEIECEHDTGYAITGAAQRCLDLFAAAKVKP